MSDDRNMTLVIPILKERSEAEAALHFLVSERREVPTFSQTITTSANWEYREDAKIRTQNTPTRNSFKNKWL